MKNKRWLMLLVVVVIALSLCLLAACNNVDKNVQSGKDVTNDNSSTTETPGGGETADPETPDGDETADPETSDGDEEGELDPEPSAPQTVTLDGVTYTYIKEGAAVEVSYVGIDADSELVIPSSVEGLPVVGIAGDAFAEGYNLAAISLPDTLEYIRDNDVLSGAKSLATKLDDLYYLGNEKNPCLALIGFSWLDEPWQVTVSAETQVILEGALGGCKATSVEVAQGNEHFVSVDGVLYDKDRTTLIAYPSCSERASFTVPDGVTTIGDMAFFDSQALTAIDLPDELTAIGYGAFFGCTNIAALVIGGSVSEIGTDAFALSGISTLTVAEDNPCYKSVDNVLYSKDGKELVCYITNKTDTSFTVPDGVNTIDEHAFWFAQLKTIILPDDVITIGDGAFESCTSLTSILIPNGVTTIGESAFESCNGLTSISIPDSVTTIGKSAFASCPLLESVKLSKNITEINKMTFTGCRELTSVEIPDGVTTIGNFAFSLCVSLGEITLPASVTTVGEGAFYYCTSLSSVTIPDGVTIIEKQTFYRCSGLAEVTFGANVTAIGEKAFAYCDALTSIDVPDSVRTIGGYAFAYSHSLAQITLGVNATTIGEFAFRECTALSSINIPDGVTTIDEGAFCDCDALTEVSLPVSVTALGKCVFGTLPVVYYEGTTAQWNAVAKAEFLFYADSKINSVVCVDGTLTY